MINVSNGELVTAMDVDANVLAAASYDNSIAFWNLKTGTLLGRQESAHKCFIRG